MSVLLSSEVGAIFFISTIAVQSVITEENACGNCSTSRFPERRDAEKHSHKETHRLAAAGNVGRGPPRCPSQDNVNIQLGFVIGNYFSLLRSLFSDVIPAMVLVRIPRRILECACSCALYTITSGLSRRRRLVSPGGPELLLTRNVRPIFRWISLAGNGRRENSGSGFSVADSSRRLTITGRIFSRTLSHRGDGTFVASDTCPPTRKTDSQKRPFEITATMGAF